MTQGQAQGTEKAPARCEDCVGAIYGPCRWATITVVEFQNLPGQPRTLSTTSQIGNLCGRCTDRAMKAVVKSLKRCSWTPT